MWELRSFLALVIAGNPFAMAMLFVDIDERRSRQHFYVTEHWRLLHSMRHQFITETAIEGHLSYVREQMRLHTQKRALVGKRFYHCPRILYQVRSMLQHGDYSLWLDSDSEHWHTLMQIKSQTQVASETVELCNRLMQEIDDLRRTKPLPKTVKDVALLEKFVSDTYISELKKETATLLAEETSN
jgi:hypothetical protein